MRAHRLMASICGYHYSRLQTKRAGSAWTEFVLARCARRTQKPEVVWPPSTAPLTRTGDASRDWRCFRRLACLALPSWASPALWLAVVSARSCLMPRAKRAVISSARPPFDAVRTCGNAACALAADGALNASFTLYLASHPTRCNFNSLRASKQSNTLRFARCLVSAPGHTMAGSPGQNCLHGECVSTGSQLMCAHYVRGEYRPGWAFRVPSTRAPPCSLSRTPGYISSSHLSQITNFKLYAFFHLFAMPLSAARRTHLPYGKDLSSLRTSQALMTAITFRLFNCTSRRSLPSSIASSSDILKLKDGTRFCFPGD